jgi:hypothetical protein
MKYKKAKNKEMLKKLKMIKAILPHNMEMANQMIAELH